MGSSLLSVISITSFDTWDVKQFYKKNIVSNYPIENLGKHLVHQTTKVQLSDFPDKDFTILGVSNKNGMFDSETVKGKKVNQKYHIVENDWIAYNPYRINVGSIGIKSSQQKGRYISPAYVVFSCKDTLLPEYLWLIMKSNFFNEIIRDSTTGTVRQTLGFEVLASLKIPIPSIAEQKKILKRYHDTINEAEKNRQSGDDFGSNLLYDIQSKVSDLKRNDLKLKKTSSIMQMTSFTATKRWEVGYILKEDRLEKIYNSFKYRGSSINVLQKESLFGLSEKASEEKKNGMIPVLRMSNVVNGMLDFSDLKYLPKECAVTDKEPEKWLLREGDFLVTRTNGSKDLIGKSAVFHESGTYTYASYLIRYRFDINIVLPEYVNILFMTPLVREQIAVMRRQGGGQYNLNSDEIGAIRIPIPSITEQQEIINFFNTTKDGSNNFYKKAEELTKKAAVDFEMAIFEC